MKLIILQGFIFCLLFSSCNYFKGGQPADIYMADSLDSADRPRLALSDRKLVDISVIEDSSMSSGFVRVRVVIDENGDVTQPFVDKSLGPREDTAAVRRTRSLPNFIPGNIKGRPVKVVYYLLYLFNPNGIDTSGKR